MRTSWDRSNYNIGKASQYNHTTRGHKRKDAFDSRLPIDGEDGGTKRSFCSSTGGFTGKPGVLDG
jgi:hypothetical protein